MRLTQHTDYALRVLIYLGLKGEALATIQEIAEAYRISNNHLMKVTRKLANCGDVESIRGCVCVRIRRSSIWAKLCKTWSRNLVWRSACEKETPALSLRPVPCPRCCVAPRRRSWQNYWHAAWQTFCRTIGAPPLHSC